MTPSAAFTYCLLRQGLVDKATSTSGYHSRLFVSESEVDAFVMVITWVVPWNISCKDFAGILTVFAKHLAVILQES